MTVGVKQVVMDCVGVCSCVDVTLPAPVCEDERDAPWDASGDCSWMTLETWLRVLLEVCASVDVGDMTAEHCWLTEFVDDEDGDSVPLREGETDGERVPDLDGLPVLDEDSRWELEALCEAVNDWFADKVGLRKLSGLLDPDVLA